MPDISDIFVFITYGCDIKGFPLLKKKKKKKN